MGLNSQLPKLKQCISLTIILFRLPQLDLNGRPLEYEDKVKFLGLDFDRKLTWEKLYKQIKRRVYESCRTDEDSCNHRMGSGFGSAKKELLKRLDYIQNEAMRVATGAFRSSPVASLQIVTNEAPLQDRREQQALKYYYKIKENLKNPARIILIAPRQQLLCRNKGITPPFPNRVKNIIN